MSLSRPCFYASILWCCLLAAYLAFGHGVAIAFKDEKSTAPLYVEYIKSEKDAYKKFEKVIVVFKINNISDSDIVLLNTDDFVADFLRGSGTLRFDGYKPEKQKRFSDGASYFGTSFEITVPKNKSYSGKFDLLEFYELKPGKHSVTLDYTLKSKDAIEGKRLSISKEFKFKFEILE